MTDTQFWALIEPTRSNDQAVQLDRLRTVLNPLSPEQLESFEVAFDRQRQRSYRWNLWGAAYVALGGASDDAFEYFRLWLISRGQHDFERVLADPDALVDIAPDRSDEMEFEDLAYVASEIWSAKTGKARDEMPHLSTFFNPDQADPAGKSFSEQPAALAAAYPRLWKRFGGEQR